MVNPKLLIVIKTSLKEILEDIADQITWQGEYAKDRGRMKSKINYYLKLIRQDKIKLLKTQ